jgi:uncharacterized membrane protein (UPF0127 family)
MVAIVLALAAFGVGETLHAGPNGSAATARMTLDGVVFRPEVALTPAARSLGLMNRREAPRDGMLFVFEHPSSGGFWMKNTLVPLTIVFFDTQGKRVRRMSMAPCHDDPCRIYDPQRVYRFALELPATDTRRALRLGPVAALRRLIRQAA